MNNEKREGFVFKLSGQHLIIYLKEELDHHQALLLRERADRIIERENVKYLIFDFSGVSFMDSSGIGMIMGRYKKVIFIGGKVAVTSVNPSVDRILRLSGLYGIMERYDSVREALEAL